MHRAIAARGRLCQAAAVVWVLALAGTTSGWAGPANEKAQYTEARTPDGVVVRERCTGLYPPSGSQADCGALAKRTADVIARLTPLLGQFPKKRLEVKAVAFTGYAGPSAAIHSPGEIDFVMNVFWPAGGDEFAPDVVPREVAREWLPSGDGDLRKAWLTEGLLHYLAWRYLLEANPQASRVLVAESMRGVGTPVQLLRMEDTAGWRAHGKNVLDQENREREKREARKRGLLILRTLETVIDRERVDRVLPEIVRRSAHQSISLVDFERVCEEIAGRDLGWFFRYFFVDQGIPEIELHRLPAESPGVVAGEILVHGLPPEGSVRVEVAVHTAQGTVEHSVATRGEVTPFTVNVPAAATEIILDPDQRILRWTDAARKSQAQSQILAGLPKGITRKNVEEAIALYRRALQADPEDDSLRAQAFRERLGELEWAHNELDAALADLEAAIDGHSIAPFETYLTRGKACLYHGVVSLHEKRPKDALEDARAGLAMPLPVLQAILPREPIESHGEMALQQLLEILSDSARRY